MADYTADAADVLTALQEDGLAMTLTQKSGGTFRPAYGDYKNGAGADTRTSTDYTVYGLIQSQTMPQSGNTGERYFNGTLIQTGDKFILMAASGLAVTPAPGDKLTVSGTVYSIVTHIAIEPGGTVLAYRLLVRK